MFKKDDMFNIVSKKSICIYEDICYSKNLHLCIKHSGFKTFLAVLGIKPNASCIQSKHYNQATAVALLRVFSYLSFDS